MIYTVKLGQCLVVRQLVGLWFVVNDWWLVDQLYTSWWVGGFWSAVAQSVERYSVVRWLVLVGFWSVVSGFVIQVSDTNELFFFNNRN